MEEVIHSRTNRDEFYLYFSRKKLDPNSYILYDLIYITFWKKQTLGI